ncbi:MAG: hypothetical protein OK456_06500, partial [Thaumarchaeota archaeon]|nr:hypothetical protein [Nitrososphaerota archaeon]
MITSRPSRWKIAVTAFAILVLMLSSQVAGSLSADMQARSPAQPSSTPLSQGQSSTPPTQSQPVPLNSTNTWSRPQQATCTVRSSATLSQPLTLQKGQSFMLTSEVPVVLGGASVAAQPTKDTFTVYANGTFLASDGQGNVISWRGVTGFPAGATAMKLYANSTEALQLYTVGPAARIANFSVVYQLATQACLPHGLGIAIQGSVNWPGAQGTLKLGFSGKLLSWNSSQAAFGGLGGGGFVFDWSDSMKAYPSTYQTNAISWSVGDNFKIDPYLVGTSQSQQALNWGGQRHLWHTVIDGTIEYWAFFYDGSVSIEDAWSLNGVTWHAAEFLAAEYGATTSDSMYSSWVTENDGVYTLYFVLVSPATKQFDLGVGQLGNNGAITGVTQTWISTAWGSDNYPCVYGSSSGVLVGVATSNGGSSQLEVFNINPSNGHVNSKSTIGTGSAQDGCIALGLISGYALLYAPAVTAAGPVVITTSANGVSWNAPLTTATSGDITVSSAVSMGNTVEFAMITSPGNEIFWNCEYPCRATSPVQTLASHATDPTLDNVVLSTDARTGGSLITATYHDVLDTYSRTSEDNGSTWSPPQLVDNGSEGQIVSGSLQADYDYVTGAPATTDVVDIAFVTPVSNGYGIWFPAYPAVVPTASTSSSPWAQSGYSPYETYFSQLDEYVSPGSGLLGISQTDLSIPGRSPALSVTRVYSAPDGFVGSQTSTTPYDHDAYTLSDLGDGWELAFPWIGAGFFHPGDGASIPLAFNSSGIMQENGALNFVLYRFSSNSSYTLYTSDGMKYVYDSAKQLEEIVSPDSPLNTLTFTYNSTPGYIIQIKDAEGHLVTFSYNANQTLASISTVGQTTRYTYSGADLSSVTDPLGRVTRFYYTAFNPWLIDEVSYATGAATNYGYQYALVAPYVVTWVVTKQTVYSVDNGKSLILARSNGYQYTMVDGSMVSTRVTFMNNTNAVQGSALLEYRQVNGKSVEQEFQYDQSGAALGSVETTFTKYGEPNSTTLVSPKGAVLATSVTHYDEWGNVNFTQDYSGHDVYYAYANTKDQYKLGNGATGLTQSYYTNSTVSSHIHTDLLATAEFQNAANSATPEETFYLYHQNEVLRQTELYVTPAGATTWLTARFTYDQFGNLATTTDPLQHQTCYAYSSAYDSGYLTSETSSGTSNCDSSPNVTVSYTYNFATGTVASETDGEGNTTSYTYDAVGRVLQVSYPAVNGVAATRSYSYNDALGTVTVTGPDGNVTKYYYDGLGRLTEEQDYLSPTSPYSAEYFSYNWLNQVVADEKPDGAVYKYTYDSLGQATGVLNPDGSHESSSYNDTTDMVTMTDGDGHLTQDVYDSLQQLVAVREYWTPTTFNATSYAYDGVGNLLKVSGPDSGQVTAYSYDDLNRVVKTTYPDGTTASSSYDAVGDLVSSTDQEGRVTTYSYDYLYRLAAVSYPDGTSTAYTYDNDGDVRTMANAVDQVKYSYDALGDLLSETDMIGGTAYTTSYTYDHAGNVQSLTYPDGSKVGYSYDALGRVTQVASGSTTYASFTYNVDDAINTMTYGNGEVASYSYDSMDRPTSIVTSQGSTQELSLSYKYDGAGNVASVNSETFGY